MTREEIMKLEGGELDEVIAELVMGWERVEDEIGKKLVFWAWAKNGEFIKLSDEWRPPTDITDALQVFRSRHLSCQVIGYTVEKPGEQCVLLNGSVPTDITPTGWALVWFCTYNGIPVYGHTMPEAICRAALLAVEDAK